jgi:SAM-dependent methyltransferase
MVTAQPRSAKFMLVSAVRAAGLLKFADTCKYLLGQARTYPSNRRFRREHPAFATPPRHLAYDALNHVDWRLYRESGLQHAGLFARVIAERTTAPGLEILEWGCGPGRLIRHMEALLPGRRVTLAGSDYNPESIAWCRANLPGIAFVENGLDPPLPLPADAFDAVYSFSVVTHLSEAVQLAWLQELRRVLKPGGILAVTTHGENYRYLLASQEERRLFDAGELVVQGRYREGRKWFLAIHPETFVRERLLAGFTAVDRVAARPEDAILQDLWVARKPGP